MQTLRSWLFVIAFYVWTIGCVLTALPMMLWSVRAGRAYVNMWASGVLKLLKWVVGIDYDVRGRGNIPDTPCIIACKHQSAWEIFALLILFPDAAFVMKRELVDLPLFGRYCLRVGMIPVERDKGGAALRVIAVQAEAALEAGRSIIIFPEGTRRPVHAPPDYKSGIAHFYARFGVPCLPIALNSGSHWMNGKTLKRPGTIILSVLPALAPGDRPKAFLKKLEEVVEAETNQLTEAASTDT
ncbi:MAG: lysophospholipid acyltransferase family protein [Pseudomonadota bacterium]